MFPLSPTQAHFYRVHVSAATAAAPRNVALIYLCVKRVSVVSAFQRAGCWA